MFTQINNSAYGCFNCSSFTGDYNLIFNTHIFPYLGFHDITGKDPLFVNPSENAAEANFRLLEGSPAIDVAFTLNSAEFDFFGNKRPAQPDLGAIERMEEIETACNAGAVHGEGNQTNFVICSGNSTSEIIQFFNTGASEDNYAYIITDEDQNIIGVEIEEFNFDATNVGLYFVYGVAYTGELNIELGAALSTLTTSGACIDISENSVAVQKEDIFRNDIATIDDKSEVNITVQDGVADLLLFKPVIATNLSVIYFLMDEAGIVLEVSENGFEIEQTEVGTCFVGGATYTGNLLIEVGVHAYDQAISDDCYAYSFNVVTIHKELEVIIPPALDGGQVRVAGTQGLINLCLGDNIPDVVSFSHTTSSTENYTYVITDEEGVIVKITTDTIQDFANLACRSCFIDGVSYTGNIIATVGDDFQNTIFTDGAYVVSENPVQIDLFNVEGGLISTHEDQIEVSVIVGDELTDIVQLNTNSTADQHYTYLLMNEGGIVIAILTEAEFDFSMVADGSYYISGLSFSGELAITVGDDINSVPLASGCFDLSSTQVQVNKSTKEIEVNGGLIAIPLNAEAIKVCVGAGQNELIPLQHNSDALEASYKFIITDGDNHLLEILADSLANFETAPEGICFIKGVSYSGMILAKTGDNLSTTDFSSGNFAFSENAVQVTRTSVDGGFLSADTGETDLSFCQNDNGQNLLGFDFVTTSDKPYALTVIDSAGILLEIVEDVTIDFSKYDAGFYFIRGVSYSGEIFISAGEDQSQIPFSDECFHHSNSVRVFWEGATESCVVNTTTSTNDFEPQQLALQLSPNPALDNILVEFNKIDQGFDKGLLEIYDMKGQLIHQQTIEAWAGDNRVEVKVENYASGIYLTKIQIGNYWGYEKFVK